MGGLQHNKIIFLGWSFHSCSLLFFYIKPRIYQPPGIMLAGTADTRVDCFLRISITMLLVCLVSRVVRLHSVYCGVVFCCMKSPVILEYI
jgi:hypothetical protein